MGHNAAKTHLFHKVRERFAWSQQAVPKDVHDLAVDYCPLVIPKQCPNPWFVTGFNVSMPLHLFMYLALGRVLGLKIWDVSHDLGCHRCCLCGGQGQSCGGLVGRPSVQKDYERLMFIR